MMGRVRRDKLTNSNRSTTHHTTKQNNTTQHNTNTTHSNREKSNQIGKMSCFPYIVCSSSAIIFAHDAQYSFYDERKGKRRKRKRRQMNQEKRFGEGGRRE
jgi:hypothetical protein